MEKVFLKKNEDKRLKKGHLWIFSNEVDRVVGNPNNGDLIEVCDSKEQFLGSGFYNKNSLIAIRLISLSQIRDLSELFSEKMKAAYDLRKMFYPHRESFRMVFSESDFLPGLIVDKYNNTFVLQVNSYGIENNIHIIVDILKNQFNAENIFTKNDSYLRKLEGLTEDDKIFYGSVGSAIISDGLIKYKIDFSQSQKTGFYFDQNDNRFFIENIVKGKTIADVFCNSGGFGLHAINANAKSIDFIDSSLKEVESVKSNLTLNGFKHDVNFFVGDAFLFLEETRNSHKKYDVVIVDPPAFAKSKKSLPAAEKGYEKLNRLALQVITDGGLLVSSSCSYHLKKETFINCINRAANKTASKVQLIHFNHASLDHPQLPSMEETSYLKFAVFKVFNA